jgi:DNA-binding helix-hairpin-helix protein with protein kinase domain
MKSISQLYDSRGNSIQLSKLLGSGGEGAVYEVSGYPDKVAKIYHSSVDSKQSAKLDAMVRDQTPNLIKVSAWPTDVLRDRIRGSVQGLIIPKVQNHREIHDLYSPATRKRYFSAADWAFLIHAAQNVAKVFETIHNHNHVIGDVNQGNIMIAVDATCKLIDCDSFQIVSDSQTYPCHVGVPQFTPPELQNKPFKGIVRSRNHDNFGLALICFHLLFMGRHPFAGRYAGTEDMPIEKAIQEFRFAYGTSAASKKMSPPPNILGLNTVTEQLRDLLERSFNESSVQPNSRPTPTEWIRELDVLKNRLRSCSKNPNHQYIETIGYCPWCNLEQSSGVLYFLSSARKVVDDVFDINRVWALIQAVQPPIKIGIPNQFSHAIFTPSPLSPLPSFPVLEIITFESFGLLPTVPTLESFGSLPALPSFPQLQVPLPTNDPPTAIPEITQTQKSKIAKVFLRIHPIKWVILLTLIALGLFLNNSLILFFPPMYFIAIVTQSQLYFSRRKHALIQAELYTREATIYREYILCKIKTTTSNEMKRRKEIAEEAMARNNAIILSRKVMINKARKVYDDEVERRNKLINQARKEANIEKESRRKIISEAKAKADSEIARRQVVLAQIKSELAKKQNDLHRNDWHNSFHQKYQDLEQTKQNWHGLKASYYAERDQEKLESYLDSFLVQDARISGIGDQLTTDLRSWGIETARDISRSKIEQVPGFGPKRIGYLVSWRNSLEKEFHRLSTLAKNNIATPQLDQKYAQQLLHLERSLRGGSEELHNIKKQIELHQSQFLDQYNQIAQRLAQAEADTAVCP